MSKARPIEWLLGSAWRLAAIVTVTLALPIVLSSEASISEALARFESGAREETLAIANATGESLGLRLGRLREVAAATANRPDIQEAISQGRADELERIVLPLNPLIASGGQQSSEVARVLIADADGRVLWPRAFGRVSRAIPPLDGTAFFAEIRGSVRERTTPNGASVLVSDLERFQSVESIFVSAHVPHGLRPFVGAVILEVRPLALAASLRAAGSSDAYLVDRRGTVVAWDRTPENHPDLSGNKAVGEALAGRYGAARGILPFSNSEGVLASASVAGTGWAVLAVRDLGVAESELLAAQAQQRTGALGLASLLVLGSLLMGMTSSRSIRRRDELALALEEEAATADILKIITRTRGDAAPVLDGVILRAVELSMSDNGSVMRLEDGVWRHVAMAGTFLDHERYFQPTSSISSKPDRGSAVGRVLLEKRTIHILDTLADRDYDTSARSAIEAVRTILAVPLFREQDVVGVIVLRRRQVVPFSSRQIRLIETFAAQLGLALEHVRRSNENVRLLEQVQVKGRELESASRHKSEFLANMSHELRTPLNAIIGFSEVLLSRMAGDLNDRQHEYVEDIRNSGEHQLALINDVLDLSKVEAGRMDLNVVPFELAAAVDRALTLVRERATREGVSISADIPAHIGRIDGDERRVTQILMNLLSNAVKFTPAGGWIGVVAQRIDDEVHVSVCDTGRGIAPEDHDRIFEEFRQAGHGPERLREGTGLGLSLSKRFIELHGGRIWLESEIGKGSTFTFAIPVTQAAETPAGTRATSS